MTIAMEMAAERNKNITQTIRAISSRLLNFIRQRVANAEDAEDILQDVFYQFAGNPEPIEQTTSWLYKVARNKIIDNYRKHKLPLADDVLNTVETDEDSIDWRELIPAEGGSPETEYLRNLFWEELQQAEIEGIPFKDIAERTGESVATLISRKRYAVLHLRDRLATLRNELLNY